jgi:hypothetical protein
VLVRFRPGAPRIKHQQYQLLKGLVRFLLFRKVLLGALKMHAKVRGSHPFCRYFCRYRKSKPSERISSLPNERIEQAGRRRAGVRDGLSAARIQALYRMIGRPLT